MYKVGNPYPIWFNKDATIVRVEPYRGLYIKLFTHVLTLTAPNTKRGTLEVSVNVHEDFPTGT